MLDKQIPKVNKGFVNKNGDFFKDVREIAFNNGELFGNLGKLVAQSNPNSSNGFMFDPDTGVYIFKPDENKDIAYRIYKCFADFGFNGYKDDFLIQNLIDRSSNIEKNSFPTGVVTLDGRVIGQEIPYFSHHCTLYEYVTSNLEKCPVKYYKFILNIIRELYNSGIIYSDLHSGNFMIDLLNSYNVEIIDFELSHVIFDDLSISSRKKLLNSYRKMILSLNYLLGVDYDIKETSDFDYMNEELDKLEKDFRK